MYVKGNIWFGGHERIIEDTNGTPIIYIFDDYRNGKNKNKTMIVGSLHNLVDLIFENIRYSNDYGVEFGWGKYEINIHNNYVDLTITIKHDISVTFRKSFSKRIRMKEWIQNIISKDIKVVIK